MRVRWSISLGLATIVAALSAPGGAQAADYCVGAGTAGCDHTYPGTGAGLQDALDDLEVDPDGFADFVRVGPGHYTAPTAAGFNYAAANPVRVIGEGIGQTVLHSDGSGNGSVALDLNGSNSGSSYARDLTVRAGGTAGSRGIRLENARAWEVRVDSDPPFQTGMGVEMRDDSRFDEGTIALPNGFLGAEFQGDGMMRDSSVTAEVGARDSTAGDALDIERCTISASQAGVSVGGAGVVGSVADTRVIVSGPTANGLYAFTGGILNARNMTVIGENANNGAYVTQGVAGTATMNLHSSTVSGFFRELTASQSGAGNAHLNVSYSNYDDVEEFGGADIAGGAGNLNVAPGFVVPFETFLKPADYHLLHSSPLVDTGSPAAPPAGSFDRDGLTRQVDGDGAGGPRRDIGAYEYQRRAPTAVLNGPAAGRTGEQLAFNATGSQDPDRGDGLSYAFNFGDGKGAIGPSVSHAFAAPGTYAIKLTVTDPTGLNATATKAVTVTTPASTQAGGDSGGASVGLRDRLAPTIGRLSMSNRRFRITRRRTALSARKAPKRGSALRFRLSERATVRISVERASAGRRVGRACKPARKRVPRSKRCRRWTKKGATLVRKGQGAGARRVAFTGRYGRAKLAPGLYRASLRAVDAAGNRSKLARVQFRVLR